MTFEYAVYNQAGVLVSRTLTRLKAAQLAQKFKGSYKKDVYEKA